MKYATAEAFRRSLETRILNQGRDGGNVQIVRLRKMVTFDRFLARLLHASPNAWVIKGAWRSISGSVNTLAARRISTLRFMNIGVMLRR